MRRGEGFADGGGLGDTLGGGLGPLAEGAGGGDQRAGGGWLDHAGLGTACEELLELPGEVGEPVLADDQGRALQAVSLDA